MGRMLDRAIQAAGLEDLAARALRGEALDAAARERLERADLMIVAGLADAVRARFRGEEVRLFEGEPQGLDLHDASLDLTAPDAPTGQEALHRIAVARVVTPAGKALGVCWDRLGFELAQCALAFGADVLWGQLAKAGSLPLLEGGHGARREEISGLVERAGRTACWQDAPRAAALRG